MRHLFGILESPIFFIMPSIINGPADAISNFKIKRKKKQGVKENTLASK